MSKIIAHFLKHPVRVIIFFIIAAAICGVLSLGVTVNHNMADYLPPHLPSTISLGVYEEEAGGNLPNARVMFKDTSIPEALAMKETLSEVDGVTDVMWLDDIFDLTIPLDVQDSQVVESYFKDGNALYTITIDVKNVVGATEEIRDILGDRGAISGSAVELADSMTASSGEVPKIMLFAVPLVLLLLLLTTSSWLEPFLFLFAIGIAILLNLGTNIIWGEISFVTGICAAILQFAVSMDYSIFLLHRFAENRQDGLDPQPAMLLAVKQSFATITSSGLTTVFGFLALVFMQFLIGADLGWALAKGIMFSLISVLFLLPALILVFEKWVAKTHHRIILRDFNKLAGTLAKLQFVALIVVVLAVVPSFLAQRETNFLFVTSEFYGEDTQIGQDRALIDETFGKSNQMVLLVPQGEPAKELELSNTIADMSYVTSVISYSKTVGNEIPTDMLTQSQKDQFFTEKYSQIIIISSLPPEGDAVFSLVGDIRDAAASVFSDDTTYLVGESVNTYDMKNLVAHDNRMVTLLAILGIGFVLLLTFRSLLLPVIMVLIIQSAIWMNLAVPYFMDTKLVFISYLILTSIQLGATVDYAILYSSRYMDYRKKYEKKEAILLTSKATMTSIVTSATILAIAGFTMGFVSNNFPISQFGILIGRGALFSAGAVLLTLPALLQLLDSPIQKLTLKSRKEETS